MHTYKWADAERALTNLAQVDASPFDDVALEYIKQTQAHRHVSSSVYHVFEGRGETINGVRFAWEQGDMFVIPAWSWHEHHNASQEQRAVLFSMHDTPTLVALNKYREEAYGEHNGHQAVTGVFDPVAKQ